MKNKVLVIIVTYNGMKWVDRCFGGLKRSTVPLDVFVVDNGSTDGTVERIRETCKEWFKETTREGGGWWLVDLVESEENLGFGQANNLGLKYALENGYEYVYLLNQDAWIEPETVSTLVSAFEKNPEYGVLSPVQMTSDMEHQDPRFEKKCSKYLPDLKSHLPGLSEVYEVPFVMAAHWMISVKCLSKVGGFSPAFHHYGEDDNFLDRCHWYKYKCGVDIETLAVHDRGNREMSKEQKLYLKYVGSVVKVSNPCNFLPWRLLWQPLELLGISIVNGSWETFKRIFSLIGSYPSLVRYRKATRKGSPFLD